MIRRNETPTEPVPVKTLESVEKTEESILENSALRKQRTTRANHLIQDQEVTPGFWTLLM